MIKEVKVKSILNRTKRRDPWFLDDYTTNPYSACSFNCLYCYIRGSKYGEHMESAMSCKINAPELLDRQLANRAKKGQYGIVVLASATDPYVKPERDFQLTRQMLEILLKYRFPVHMITKSDMITRDLDLLKAINEKAILPQDLQNQLRGSTIVSFSFSTLDNKVSRIFEPGATAPSVRLEAVKQVKASGLTTGISLMPLIPYISDTGQCLEEYFSTFSKIKIDYLLPAPIALYGHGKADSRTLMLKAIEKHYPHLLQKYQKFFGSSDELPAYYRGAFRRKMNELAEKYRISLSIIPEQR